jgi:hypothetical protein
MKTCQFIPVNAKKKFRHCERSAAIHRRSTPTWIAAADGLAVTEPSTWLLLLFISSAANTSTQPPW